MQGCPFSLILAMLVMAAWAMEVSRKVPEVCMGTLLDDRTIWSSPRRTADPVRTVARAMDAGIAVDRAFGMVQNADKCECFSMLRPAGLGAITHAKTPSQALARRSCNRHAPRHTKVCRGADL